MSNLNFPQNFQNSKLNEKWLELIKIRNICNISIEEKRASKEIGSSLEAELKIMLDQKLKDLVHNIDFSELSKGIYLIELQTELGFYKKKIILQ